MDFIYNAIGQFLGWLDAFTGNYVLALFIFAIIVELLMLPFGLRQQKNSIKQATLRPKEMAIRKKYAGRNDQPTQQKMMQEIQEMYQKEGYNPMGGCLPLLIQFPVIIILYNVVINPLRYIMGVSKETVSALERVDGIADATSSREVFQRLVQIRRVVDIVSLTLVAMLGAVSVFIIANTVKLAMFARRDEIGIMKMVGATNGFIRLPFVVEGFTLGMMGAALAFGIEWVMYDALVARIAEVDALNLFSFVPFAQLLVPMIITFCAAGLFVGIVGSWTSIRKFMDV